MTAMAGFSFARFVSRGSHFHNFVQRVSHRRPSSRANANERRLSTEGSGEAVFSARIEFFELNDIRSRCWRNRVPLGIDIAAVACYDPSRTPRSDRKFFGLQNRADSICSCIHDQSFRSRVRANRSRSVSCCSPRAVFFEASERPQGMWSGGSWKTNVATPGHHG